MKNETLNGFNDSELLIISSDDEDIDVKGIGLLALTTVMQIRGCCEIQSRCCK